MTQRRAAAAILLAWALAAFAAEPLERFGKVAERLVEAINDGDYVHIDAAFNQEMREALPPERSEAFFRNLVTDFGKIETLEPGRFVPPDHAVFPARFERGLLDMTITLDNEDQIAGLLLLPHTEDIPAPERNTVPLRLPFEGLWFVFWGGDTRDLNQHHDTPNQRHAFDFLAVDEAGKSHAGEGKANEDYYAFGRKILAPADGVVTDVIEGVRDNRPASMNPYSGLGNAVFIRHAEHEISVLAHFKLGSITVKVGEKVKAGQGLGLCGNSGNSSEPHLHYHLQNTPVMQDATGIKCSFSDVKVTRAGKTRLEPRYSPIKGDRVEPQ
ncbi:MAG: peptidoglycan DD-metalloendopeptidase family protein [Sedimentisphaerales bacterium]|nr:peptidoglycan DD-metalloendopeptidase family protein [Sedimentisphaerales bacterium]